MKESRVGRAFFLCPTFRCFKMEWILGYPILLITDAETSVTEKLLPDLAIGWVRRSRNPTNWLVNRRADVKDSSNLEVSKAFKL